MMEFVAFFVVPFDEDMPRSESESAIEKAKAVKSELETECLDAYKDLRPMAKKHDKQVWAQSRIDFETRVIGVSLRLPIEKGADKDLVPAVTHDDFLYWDYDELTGEMDAMRQAVSSVAEKHGAVPHFAYSDVKYHY